MRNGGNGDDIEVSMVLRLKMPREYRVLKTTVMPTTYLGALETHMSDSRCTLLFLRKALQLASYDV